jgi:aryl-phospho-beta-D-glucosidase BglC (GH1 family)
MRLGLFTTFWIFLIFLCNCTNEETIPATDNNQYDPIDPISIDVDDFSRGFRGFNLQGKFDVHWSNTGFKEEEFIIMNDLGFNFARLPLDYQTYTEIGDWDTFLEDEVKEIDQAIEWGKQYGVHICINLHRAPGYSVNQSSIPANQQLDLWTDPVAQSAFVNHWAYFAERYRDIPYNEVSFNLVNEPADVDEATYVNVMQMAIDKIHGINPNRIIFVDGIDWGNHLIMSLKGARNIIQAIHMYEPFKLTHYKASWADGSDTWPLPEWPITNISNYLYGSWKNDLQSSLVFEGAFAKDDTITINVHQVSIVSTLKIMLDDTEIYSKHFVCGSDLGEDWTEINLTEWGYQNYSRKDYSVVLPSVGSKLTISNTLGDWMTMNKITISTSSFKSDIIPGNTAWGTKQDSYKINSEGEITNPDGSPVLALGDLKETLETAKSQQIPVMIQEFGVYNKTPHDVTLDYLSDVVDMYNEYQVGYALWNLINDFGILDSDRSDCDYTPYNNRQLDQAMLDILKGN